MCTNPQDANIQRYQILKASIDEMQMEKGKKAMLWSGIRWMEEGEKPSRYFLNLCANKVVKSQINVLHTIDDNVITDSKLILAHCKTYFEKNI